MHRTVMGNAVQCCSSAATLRSHCRLMRARHANLKTIMRPAGLMTGGCCQACLVASRGHSATKLLILSSPSLLASSERCICRC